MWIGVDRRRYLLTAVLAFSYHGILSACRHRAHSRCVRKDRAAMNQRRTLIARNAVAITLLGTAGMIHTYSHLSTPIHTYPHLSTPIHTYPHISTPTPVSISAG